MSLCERVGAALDRCRPNIEYVSARHRDINEYYDQTVGPAVFKFSWTRLTNYDSTGWRKPEKESFKEQEVVSIGAVCVRHILFVLGTGKR